MTDSDKQNLKEEIEDVDKTILIPVKLLRPKT